MSHINYLKTSFLITACFKVYLVTSKVRWSVITSLPKCVFF